VHAQDMTAASLLLFNEKATPMLLYVLSVQTLCRVHFYMQDATAVSLLLCNKNTP